MSLSKDVNTSRQDHRRHSLDYPIHDSPCPPSHPPFGQSKRAHDSVDPAPASFLVFDDPPTLSEIHEGYGGIYIDLPPLAQMWYLAKGDVSSDTNGKRKHERQWMQTPKLNHKSGAPKVSPSSQREGRPFVSSHPPANEPLSAYTKRDIPTSTSVPSEEPERPQRLHFTSSVPLALRERMRRFSQKDEGSELSILKALRNLEPGRGDGGDTCQSIPTLRRIRQSRAVELRSGSRVSTSIEQYTCHPDYAEELEAALSEILLFHGLPSTLRKGCLTDKSTDGNSSIGLVTYFERPDCEDDVESLSSLEYVDLPEEAPNGKPEGYWIWPGKWS